MKTTIPNTNADQTVGAAQLDSNTSAPSLTNWTTIQNTGSNAVWILRQDSGTPTCQTVIDNGNSIAVNATFTIYDKSGSLSPGQIFLACSTGAGELRIFS
jgi:hypothetical protein